ncbi:MAG: CDP-diacylglycerol--glycerol-3-phosphate 3-phosphatidyltransferase [Myxococcota bacterium]
MTGRGSVAGLAGIRPAPRSLRAQAVFLPNLITYARILAIPAVMVVMQQGSRRYALLAATLFSLASVTDVLDGYLARRLNQVSMIGKFLDPLADKLIVLGASVMLVELGRVSSWLVFIIISREIVITTLRTIAMGEGVVIAARNLGKWKTAFQMTGLAALILHYDYPLPVVGVVSFHLVGMALLLASIVLSLWSAGDYFFAFFRTIRARDTDLATK